MQATISQKWFFAWSHGVCPCICTVARWQSFWKLLGRFLKLLIWRDLSSLPPDDSCPLTIPISQALFPSSSWKCQSMHRLYFMWEFKGKNKNKYGVHFVRFSSCKDHNLVLSLVNAWKSWHFIRFRPYWILPHQQNQKCFVTFPNQFDQAVESDIAHSDASRSLSLLTLRSYAYNLLSFGLIFI